MLHELKTWPCYYEALLSGDKTFEIRRNNDRGFQRGDTLLLQEFRPELNQYSGREWFVEVTYVTNFGQQQDYVVMGIRGFEGHTTRPQACLDAERAALDKSKGAGGGVR